MLYDGPSDLEGLGLRALVILTACTAALLTDRSGSKRQAAAADAVRERSYLGTRLGNV